MVTAQGARVRRDEGIANAKQGQLFRDPDWLEESLCLLRVWSRGRGRFLAEDFLESGVIIRPEEGRAMGALFRVAAARGIVRKAGYALARSSNMSPKVQWEAA